MQCMKGDNRLSVFRTPPATHTYLQITQVETKTELPKSTFHFSDSKAKTSTNLNQQLLKQGQNNSLIAGKFSLHQKPEAYTHVSWTKARILASAFIWTLQWLKEKKSFSQGAN